MLHNISSGLGGGGLRNIITEILGTDGSPITLEKIIELKDRITYEPFQKRAAANKLTGGWIVYLPHEAKNYYLRCGAHKVAVNSFTTASCNTVCGISPSSRRG